MNGDGDSGGGYGIGHLASMPITLTFGALLLFVLILLIVLRIFFDGIRVGGSR